MERFSAAAFVQFMVFLASYELPKGNDNENISEDDRGNWRLEIADLESRCKKISLSLAAEAMGHMQYLLRQQDVTYGEIREQFVLIRGRIIDGMKTQLFMYIPPKDAELYNWPKKDWEKIITRFPATVRDIEEAKKCFALSRYTASVFHSVQIIEVGLVELGTFINVNDPKSGWTAVANELHKIVSGKRELLNQFEKDNFEFLEQVQGTVEALKNAWRNKISHAHGKLTLSLNTDFTAEIAEEIMIASRAFMRRLAD